MQLQIRYCACRAMRLKIFQSLWKSAQPLHHSAEPPKNDQTHGR